MGTYNIPVILFISFCLFHFSAGSYGESKQEPRTGYPTMSIRYDMKDFLNLLQRELKARNLNAGRVTDNKALMHGSEHGINDNTISHVGKGSLFPLEQRMTAHKYEKRVASLDETASRAELEKYLQQCPDSVPLWFLVDQMVIDKQLADSILGKFFHLKKIALPDLLKIFSALEEEE